MIRVSPTSLSRAECRRRQAYSRTRPRPPQPPTAAFGERLHTVAAAWLRDHVAPDPSTPEGACILAGLPYLPMPGTCTYVEDDSGPLSTFVHGGVEYAFRADFEYERATALGLAIVDGDHKSCGRLDRTHFGPEGPRRREPADLTDDLQRIIYGEWSLRRHPHEYVGAHWQYYQRKPEGHTMLLFVIEHRDNLHARFLAMHDARVPEFVADHGRAPEELPRNLDRCADYGGCPYRAECHADLDPAEAALATLRRRA